MAVELQIENWTSMASLGCHEKTFSLLKEYSSMAWVCKVASE